MEQLRNVVVQWRGGKMAQCSAFKCSERTYFLPPPGGRLPDDSVIRVSNVMIDSETTLDFSFCCCHPFIDSVRASAFHMRSLYHVQQTKAF